MADKLIDEFNTRIQQTFDADGLLGVLHVAISVYESVRGNEPNRRRYLQLNNGIDHLLELLNIFEPDECSKSTILKASELGDEFDLRIRNVFGDQIEPGRIQA